MNAALFALVNGKQTSTISIDDRGLTYGDGVFRTIAISDAKPKYLAQHLQKLGNDCERMAIPVPDRLLLNEEINLLCSRLIADKAVLKIIVTRGVGERGYRINPYSNPSRILALYAWPDYPVNYYLQGVRVGICNTRLSSNSQLAGIKHLNRLEQILARNEWQDNDIGEGLMLDGHNHVISGTSSNLFMVKNNTLLTPKLKYAGVTGVMREIILNKVSLIGINCEIKNISLADLYEADELFLTNSLIGIWPVKQLGESYFTVGEITRRLQVDLNFINPLGPVPKVIAGLQNQ